MRRIFCYLIESAFAGKCPLVRWAVAVFLTLSVTGAFAQRSDYQVKVLGFEEGLIHRNVFKVQQDQRGYLWLGAINGLDRYDGYRFVHYNRNDPQHTLPVEYVSDLHIDARNQIWVAHPRQMSLLLPETNRTISVPLPEGTVPSNLTEDAKGRVWAALFDEKSGATRLQRLDTTNQNTLSIPVPGMYARRPMARLGKHLYAGAWENELWKIDAGGKVVQKMRLPAAGSQLSRIVHLQALGDSLFILCSDSRVFSWQPRTGIFSLHPISSFIQDKGKAATLLAEPGGNVWVAGQNILWHYNAAAGQVSDMDEPIRQSVKNYLNYRQIMADRSGVVWVASDFGLIKLTRSVRLFTNYLSGGSEYCSDGFCSTRGIAEDDKGNIYISYYNSIHVLNPRTEYLRPLFPNNDFHNIPFGLLWKDNALWTGNGIRIDLKTMRTDTIFAQGEANLASVCADQDGKLWFGYRKHLYWYDPETRKTTELQDLLEPDFEGEISYVYPGKDGRYLWVGTLQHGVYRLDVQSGRSERWHLNSAPASLASNEVNAIYEDSRGYVWLSTINGLHRLKPATNEVRIFTDQDGLPNNILAGFLSEGDTCLWISTFRGLCRFNIQKGNCVNFFETDGLSHNEFNRTSFFRSRDGRMYFGGLNGVNAFYPGPALADLRTRSYDAPLLLTGFTRFDGDSLFFQSTGLESGAPIVLTHRDRMFSFSFALADFRQTSDKQFSYQLESYESNWSQASAINEARYNNIPAGRYTFRVRARSGNNDWSEQVLEVPVIIRQAYYRSNWFLGMCALLLLGGAYGYARYRVYTLRRRGRVLEQLVSARTQQLENARQESESLLLNILPAQIADELKRFGKARARMHEQATVMFSDFRDFSNISEHMEPEALVAEIDACFRAFDEITDRHGLEKIKTIGDAYMCMVIDNGNDGALRSIRAALEIQDFLRQHADNNRALGKPFFEARIGIHTGPIVAGVVGYKKFAYDIWGDTVNIASRMETHGETGQVNISGATKALVENDIACTFRGRFSARHDREIEMYFVEG